MAAMTGAPSHMCMFSGRMEVMQPMRNLSRDERLRISRLCCAVVTGDRSPDEDLFGEIEMGSMGVMIELTATHINIMNGEYMVSSISFKSLSVLMALRGSGGQLVAIGHCQRKKKRMAMILEFADEEQADIFINDYQTIKTGATSPRLDPDPHDPPQRPARVEVASQSTSETPALPPRRPLTNLSLAYSTYSTPPPSSPDRDVRGDIYSPVPNSTTIPLPIPPDENINSSRTPSLPPRPSEIEGNTRSSSVTRRPPLPSRGGDTNMNNRVPFASIPVLPPRSSDIHEHARSNSFVNSTPTLPPRASDISENTNIPPPVYNTPDLPPIPSGIGEHTNISPPVNRTPTLPPRGSDTRENTNIHQPIYSTPILPPRASDIRENTSIPPSANNTPPLPPRDSAIYGNTNHLMSASGERQGESKKSKEKKLSTGGAKPKKRFLPKLLVMKDNIFQDKPKKREFEDTPLISRSPSPCTVNAVGVPPPSRPREPPPLPSGPPPSLTRRLSHPASSPISYPVLPSISPPVSSSVADDYDDDDNYEFGNEVTTFDNNEEYCEMLGLNVAESEQVFTDLPNVSAEENYQMQSVEDAINYFLTDEYNYLTSISNITNARTLTPKLDQLLLGTEKLDELHLDLYTELYNNRTSCSAIGQAFLSRQEQLEFYKYYLMNAPLIMKELSNLPEAVFLEHQNLKESLRTSWKRPHFYFMSLESLLSKVQEDDDKSPLQNAVMMLRELNRLGDAGILIDAVKGAPFNLHIKAPLLLHSTFKVKMPGIQKKDHRVLLFAEMLVITLPEATNYSYQCSLRLDQLHLVQAKSHAEVSFAVEVDDGGGREKKYCEFKAPSAETKDLWITEINRLLHNILNEEKKDS